MRATIQKWGDSLAVRIPQPVADHAHLTEGGTIDLSLVEGKIVISPQAPTPSLDEMVSRITEENIHEEIEFGPPMGKEIW